MIKRLYKQYAKDLTVATLISDYGCLIKPKKDLNLNKYFVKALNNYCRLRLKLLQNKDIQTIEEAVIKAGVKAGIVYAAKEFGLSVNTEDINKYVDKYLPEIIRQIHEDRTNLFIRLVNRTSSNES